MFQRLKFFSFSEREYVQVVSSGSTAYLLTSSLFIKNEKRNCKGLKPLGFCCSPVIFLSGSSPPECLGRLSIAQSHQSHWRKEGPQRPSGEQNTTQSPPRRCPVGKDGKGGFEHCIDSLAAKKRSGRAGFGVSELQNMALR